MKTSEGAKDGEDRDVWSDLPDNLIEVPPVSLQSFMLKYKNKFRGRRGETEIKSPTAKTKVQKEKNNQPQILLNLTSIWSICLKMITV